MRNKLWREVAIVSPKHVFGTAIPSGGIKLHGGAIAELLHIAERKRSNASSVKAKLENAEDEALSVKDQGHAKPSFFL